MKKTFVAAVIFALLLQTIFVASVQAIGPPHLEKKTFVHFARPDKGKPQPPSETGDYVLLGIKWRTLPVVFEINPENSLCDSNTIISSVLNGANEWDDGTYSLTDDWKGVKKNLFVDTVVQSSKTFDASWDQSDGVNTILWGNLDDEEYSGVIAVTNIWYNPILRIIVEFDIVFNTDFSWSTSGESDKMDVQNIATHELGHAVGLGDLYGIGFEETMYGYATYGETKKQDLYYGDQTGIKKLYR